MINEPTSEALDYQGRKAIRVKSEARRRLILEAALNIIAKEGVRAIRHRAVAKEANVPLAATTYYFKDIDELIVDTFTLYTEKALEEVNQFSAEFKKPFSNLLSKPMNKEVIEPFIEHITEQIILYIQNQIENSQTMLIIEQAFRYEAVLNSRIKELVQIHQKALKVHLKDFFKLLNSPNPEEDATIMLALFNALEYQLLLNQDSSDNQPLKSVIHRHLSLLSQSLNR